MKKFALTAAAIACGFGLMAGNALAGPVLGAAYFVPEAEAQNAVIGFAHGAANATFSVPNGPISFTSCADFACTIPTTHYTLGSWLATSPGEITLTGTAADLARNLDVAGPPASGTIVEFKGSVSVVNGQTFTVRHDDGLQLMIGALLVVNDAGPTSPTVTTVTYTGPTGNFAFDLVYGECCGGPAVLATSLPLNVPEPGSLALVGLALFGLGAVRRRQQ